MSFLLEKKDNRRKISLSCDIFNESIEQALNEEIGPYKELDGIGIMTDARLCWRKNAQDSNVVAMGEKTHRVLQCVHLTKQDDIVS